MQTYTYTLKLKTNTKMKKELNKRLQKGLLFIQKH